MSLKVIFRILICTMGFLLFCILFTPVILYSFILHKEFAPHWWGAMGAYSFCYLYNQGLSYDPNRRIW